MNLLHLEGRTLLLQGVTKVVSSSQSQAVVQCGDSLIVLTGSSIEVKKLELEKGEVCLEGNFTNIKLGQQKEKQPLFKRIFK